MYTMHDDTTLPIFKEVVKEYKPKTVIDIGTYYGGLAYEISKILEPDGHVFGFQSLEEKHLIHMPDTSEGDYSQGSAGGEIDPRLKDQDWKHAVQRIFPNEYHSWYDFNLLIKTFQKMNNATLVLDTSPLKYPWKIGFDLCIIDISPTIDENINQSNYWSQYANPNGILMIGAYTHQDEYFKWAQERFKAVKKGDHHILVFPNET